MAKYSRDEFCMVFDVANRNFGTMANRGTILATDAAGNATTDRKLAAFVDDSTDVNSRWIERRITKLKREGKWNEAATPTALEVRSKGKSESVSSEESEDDIESPPTHQGLYLGNDLTKLAAEKDRVYIQRQYAAKRLDDIKYEKARGEIIPVELIMPLFIQYSKNVITAFENAANDWLVQMQKRFDIPQDEMTKAKTDIVRMVNRGNQESVQQTKKQIPKMVADFADVRGKGERK